MEVQINSLPGLEKVIGDNQSFVLEIKRSVWNEYVHKHILEELKGEDGQRIVKELKGSILCELQHWANDNTYKAIKEDPRYQSLITDLARKLIRAEVEKLVEKDLCGLVESQGEQLKRMVSEACVQIVNTKISEQFKGSMKSFMDIVKQNLTQKA